MGESEFGKGLVICLVKFAEHRWRWQDQKRQAEEMAKENPELFNESYAVEMHMNGASDHLYEIEVPEKWIGTDLGKMVKDFQDFGLEMRHIFNGKKWTEEDVTKAYNMCQEIAFLIDKELGLEPDIGSW